ncbi:MAG: hypothetical protein ISS33_05820 [Candidatus Omnitrophica bacterium]|nr:hypothetical protein [Candidatus Omnitrophota bacterium]
MSHIVYRKRIPAEGVTASGGKSSSRYTTYYIRYTNSTYEVELIFNELTNVEKLCCAK